MSGIDKDMPRGSSPASRGGTGAYIEGELGAFYLLAMLANAEPRGMPGSRIASVRFQGVELGYTLDDLVVHGVSNAGDTLLEIQSKRTIKFAPKDPIFKGVCLQIANGLVSITDEQHLLAVATQRTSYAISGAYQDVLKWAREADSGAQFFNRLSARGVAGSQMREFGETFRANLVEAGVRDDDDTIWKIIKRFLILEFDFESMSPLARVYALSVATQVLSAQDASRAPSLWSNLTEISLATAKVGGSLDRDTLRRVLIEYGFELAGDTNLSLARAKLADMARLALADIDCTIVGIHLPRLGAIKAFDEARERHRVIEIRGGPGVGKSAVLRHLAERVVRESHVFVLDPVGTPAGGWGALSLMLGVPSTAGDFLRDLAASGGSVLFIDSLEMFTSPERQRTVNDLLREASVIEGFSVAITARPDFGLDGDNWLADDAIKAFGGSRQITVGELDDAEVAALSEHAPELRALLQPGHPAADIARNLYRLSQLLKAPSSAIIRTEAALCERWWRTADGAASEVLRAAQRLITDLGRAALVGQHLIQSQSDSPARSHLLRSRSLSEVRRDHLAFSHDVMRDWAIGELLHEDLGIVGDIDLGVAASPSVTRGIEFAGRLALEKTDCESWLALLAKLSPAGSHGSWRRHALMAIARSELSPALLERCSTAMLANGGALLSELSIAILVLDTIPIASILKDAPVGIAVDHATLQSVRTANDASAPRLLRWCVRHRAEIPFPAIAAVLKVIDSLFFAGSAEPAFGEPVARMLMGWLLQLDVRGAKVMIPTAGGPDRSYDQSRKRLVTDLRTTALLWAPHASDDARAYLRALMDERDTYKFKAIRMLSGALARAAPQELADLSIAKLLQPKTQRRSGPLTKDRAFSFVDTDFFPPSPAQQPFLQLLEVAPSVGLSLVRKLTQEAVGSRLEGAAAGDDGFTLVFPEGLRFFPLQESYFWSRGTADHYSVASALMALEAWGHARIGAGEPLDSVLNDVLGEEECCCAFLLVAIDLLLSHWPDSRDLLVPFISCPALLTIERYRGVHQGMERMTQGIGRDPPGRVRLADLAAKQSRSFSLDQLLPFYRQEDDTARQARALLTDAVGALGAYKEGADFGDPAFVGSHALNLLDHRNWVDREGRSYYQPPPVEAEQFARLNRHASDLARSSDIEAKIQIATSDPARGTPQIAQEAAAYAAGTMPDASESDDFRPTSTRLIASAMLVARDGDDALLDEHESWLRAVIGQALEEERDRRSGSGEILAYNRPALAICALIHLWCRRGLQADRDAVIRAAARDDRSAPPAFAAAMTALLDRDPRVLKAAVRVAFQACRWRWSSWGEDQRYVEEYRHRKSIDDQGAIDAEVAWLDGDEEPRWPRFPSAKPLLRDVPRLRIQDARSDVADDLSGRSEPADHRVEVDTQSLAKWLHLAATAAWGVELVKAYADWSARANGFSYQLSAEFDRSPSEWNNEFYVFMANVMMDAAEPEFEALLEQVEGLPDQPFGDVAEILLHAADVRYFNDPQRSSDRAVELRKSLVRRVMTLERWAFASSPGDLSIDRDTAGVVARVLMNTYDPFNGTKSYLVPAVYDRIDPLLETLRPMLPGGPTSFVALCVLNTLLVAPRPGHADFLLSGVEAWLRRLPTDVAVWIDLGIARNVVEWIRAAADDASLSRGQNPLRERIDQVLGRLVDLGVPEAHELEKTLSRKAKG